jgi:curved DNA-binding protein CbpA
VHLKDYYTILELPPSASLDEIKKAYRRLALIYHPDKKGNDPYSIAQFTEIKEAYETLTHPVKKDLYLQQRWYAQSIGQKRKQEVVTPVTVLKQLLELDRYSSRLDVHRMDKEGLYQYLLSLLSNENILTLNSFHEESVNKEIINSALKIGHYLTLHNAKNIAERLKKITGGNTELSDKIDEFISRETRNDYWEQRRVWIIAIIVAILCVGIFVLAKRPSAIYR